MTVPTRNTSVSGHFVIDQVAGAVAQGYSVAELLTQSGIDTAILQNPEQRVTFQAFAALMLNVWMTMNDEAGGYMERPLKVGSFNMMCHATINCPNLRRALLRGARYYEILTDDLRMELVEKGQEAHFNIRHRPSHNLDNRYFYESLLLIWSRWASWLIDKKILISHINFSFSEPAIASEYNILFPYTRYYDQPATGFVIPTRYLDMRIAQDSQTLSEFLAASPKTLLTHYKKDESLSAQVRHLLHHSSAVENLSLEDAANQLHLTSQTLRRRLKEEGNAFQEIKDSVRRDTATYHLLLGEKSINEIAQLMGFSEPSVFHRAFKKWTGMTPGAYREAHQAPSARD